MAVTQNTYTGNGSTVLYSFSFPYLESTDIKVSLNGTTTTAYTLANATTIQFNTAPANGVAIRIYRETENENTKAMFYPGAAIRAQDLNDNFDQVLFVTQESTNTANAASTSANTALTNSTTAVSTANTALSTANTASTNASAAVTTANTANTNASAAVTTANTAATNAAAAVSTANTASSTATAASTASSAATTTANSALTAANAATTTANTAASNASTAISTANTALSTANTANTNASSAVSTANTANTNATAALNAVASSVQYVLVANVAGIPSSPANLLAIEVADSTGIESFVPIANVPAGFVGDTGLSVRLQYTSTGSTWNWLNYFPNNSETRYLKLTGGTMTGQLRADDSTSVASPVYSFDGDTNTGLAHTGADELALVTGGTARLTFDAAGNATFTNSVNLPAGSSVSGYLSSTTAASTYQTIAGMSSYLTQTSAASTYAPIASPTFTGTVTIPAGASISGYLNSSTAASTYQTQAGMSSYLTTASAGATYAPLASPTFTGTVTIPAGASISGYLTTASAASTYLTTSSAASTYQTQAGMSSYAPLASPTFTGQPYVNGSYRANIVAVAALDIDCSAGNYFTKTINGNSTFTVSSVPVSRAYSFILELTHTSGTVTWFSGVEWPGGTAPTLTTGKTHLFVFVTDDGGTRWRGSSLINYTN